MKKLYTRQRYKYVGKTNSKPEKCQLSKFKDEYNGWNGYISQIKALKYLKINKAKTKQ